jgi:hypothetical protein
MPSGSSIHISVKPYGSAACSRMTRAPAAASRAYSARTSRIWIQIITERPGGPCAWPETSSNPWPRKNTTPGSSGDRTPGRWPGRANRDRSGGCGPGRLATAGSGCSKRPRHHFSITLSEAGGHENARSPAVRRGSRDLGLQPLRRAERDVRCPPGMVVGYTRPYCIWG